MLPGSDGGRLGGFLKILILLRAGQPMGPRMFRRDPWCGWRQRHLPWSQASVLCSPWALAALGNLAGRLIRLARLEGEAGVGRGQRASRASQQARIPHGNWCPCARATSLYQTREAPCPCLLLRTLSVTGLIPAEDPVSWEPGDISVLASLTVTFLSVDS